MRYDLAVETPEYVRELATHHVGGYLKIAPEHVAEGPLSKMMKPGIGTYDRFKALFERYSEAAGKKQYLIPYFIAAHPGTTDEDMLELALWLKQHGFKPDQVQAFLPSPMATATAMYHTGLNPLRRLRRGDDSLAVDIPRKGKVRRLHKAFLRYHDPRNWPMLRRALREMGRGDLIGNRPGQLIPPPSAEERREQRREQRSRPRRGRRPDPGTALTQHTDCRPGSRESEGPERDATTLGRRPRGGADPRSAAADASLGVVTPAPASVFPAETTVIPCWDAVYAPGADRPRTRDRLGAMLRRAWGYCVGLAWLTGCAASGDDGGLDGFAEASATITEGASSGMGETEGAEQSGTLGSSGDGDGDGDPGGDGDASSSGDGDGDGDPGGDGDASSSGDGDGDGDPSGDGDASSSSGDGDGDGDPGGDGDGDPPPPDETTCASAAQSLTSAGCRFAPIIGNPSSETFMGPLPWAVIAANPNAFATTARLYAPSGALLETATVDPLGSHVFELDGPASQTWEHKKASGVSDLAFLLESDTPITAYQYQPYSTSFSATADGSLLLPEHAWNTNYLMVEASAGPQWLTVVSLQDGTEVTVRRDAAAVGSTDSGGGVPALAAGDEHTEILDAQQTLRIYSSGSDLSGTAVFSSTNDPFAVIAGSPGMSLPDLFGLLQRLS